MKSNIACSRSDFIRKLQEMNFSGPFEVANYKYMLYHGRVFTIPIQENYTIPQFRFLLAEVEKIVSSQEWQR